MPVNKMGKNECILFGYDLFCFFCGLFIDCFSFASVIEIIVVGSISIRSEQFDYRHLSYQ